jgi:hypothetical protein
MHTMNAEGLGTFSGKRSLVLIKAAYLHLE